MSVELLLIGLAVLVTAALLSPIGRHLARTAFDLVDGSLAVYALRRSLGLDTTTHRERRIARRRAAEQAELERRIGIGPPVAAVPAALPPTRLVASGEPAAPGSAVTRPPVVGRGQLLRDAGVVLAVIVVAVVGVNLVGGSGPAGGVLGATGRPDGGGVAPTEPDPTPTATPSPFPTPSPAARAAPPAAEPAVAPLAATSPPTPTPTPEPAPVAAVADRAAAIELRDLRWRLTGRRAGGPTVAVRLAWAAVDGQGRRGTNSGIAGFELRVSVDGGGYRTVDRLGPSRTSLVRDVRVGATHAFRLHVLGATGRAGPVADWPAIRVTRHQESSRLARYRGTWRTADGPSLSGGLVRYAPGGGGERVTVRFRGRDIGWVATRTPRSGRARVAIDGRAVATVDLRAADVRYRQLVFREHLADDGPHVLEIRALGGGRIDVDAFVVVR